MIKKIIFIFVIAVLLFGFFYERLSIYISKISTKGYYKTHPELIDTSSKIESSSYAIKKISNYRGYSGNVRDMIFYDEEKSEFVWEFHEAQKKIIISKNGSILEIGKNLDIERKSKLPLEIYPKKYHAFEHSWKSKGAPINITKYHKKRFEWPSSCPYTNIPICNGWKWSGNAFFEVEHNGEKLKFNLDTEYNIFTGYNGQVYKLSLPETMNSKVSFLNVNMSSNNTSRTSGWYVILPKSKL